MADYSLARDEFVPFLQNFPGFDTSKEPAEIVRPMLASFPPPPMPDPSVANVESVEIKNKDGEPLRVLVVRPAGKEGKIPFIFAIHGGGGLFGVPELDLPFFTAIAQAGYAIVSPDYRLAPEHPSPAAANDVDSTFAWTTSPDVADRFSLDVTRWGLYGSSQGAQMAASFARRLRGHSHPPKVTILDSVLADDRLIYPSMDADEATSKYHVWTKANAIASAQWLYGSKEPTVNESPLRSTSPDDFKGLGPHYITSCELDSLAEHGPELAKRLEKAGVPVEFKQWDGAIHAFLTLVPEGPLAKEAQQLYISWFDKHLK